jgi:thymidylate synthase ThyX
MSYKAAIILDSVSKYGDRLTTFEVTLPRIVLAEFNTHRMLSRNSASSRAIPVEKQLLRIMDDPFIPVYWGVNQSGMQAATELSPEETKIAIDKWLRARDYAVLSAVELVGGHEQLNDKGLQARILKLQKTYKFSSLPLKTPLHKQIANRLLEPFMWHTIITTATDWSNFFALRANPQAQPEIQKAAYLMLDEYRSSKPKTLQKDEWHLPLIQPDEYDLLDEELKKISTARCARVSYLTHAGKRDKSKDIELHDNLMKSGHMSPLEHAARPMTPEERQKSTYSGNFRGWHQYRKELPHENDYSLIK